MVREVNPLHIRATLRESESTWSEPMSEPIAFGHLEAIVAQFRVERDQHMLAELNRVTEIWRRLELFGYASVTTEELILLLRYVLVANPTADFIDGPVVEVKLDECWKCQTPVPKDDEFGLCSSCNQAMKDFTDEPTPVAPAYGGFFSSGSNVEGLS